VIISIPPGGSRGSTFVEVGFLLVLLPPLDPDPDPEFDPEAVLLALLLLLELGSLVVEGVDVADPPEPEV
jgi:hypothetical protein